MELNSFSKLFFSGLYYCTKVFYEKLAFYLCFLISIVSFLNYNGNT